MYNVKSSLDSMKRGGEEERERGERGGRERDGRERGEKGREGRRKESERGEELVNVPEH